MMFYSSVDNVLFDILVLLTIQLLFSKIICMQFQKLMFLLLFLFILPT